MEKIVETARELALKAVIWLRAEVMTPDALIQALIVIGTFMLALLLDPPVRRMVGRALSGLREDGNLRRLIDAVLGHMRLIVWLVLLVVGRETARYMDSSGELLVIAISLLAAWIVIQLGARLLRDPFWERVVSVIAWSIAALSILDLIEPTRRALDTIGLDLGESRLSMLTVVQGLLALAVFMWLANLVGHFVEKRLQGASGITPSLQVLFSKVVRAGLIALAIVVALGTAGVDLTAFAIFSGALGVGLGFGLQKVVSNLISGIILLLDRSIKPGDVIAIDDTYGHINSLRARYVSVITRDSTEFLILNEDLITQRVENWTYSSTQVRLKIPVGVSYDSDVPRAIELCVESAQAVARVLDEPAPRCLLRGFGDSSVDLELRLWIEDPANGITNVRSDVMLEIWERFHANDIGFPFPQRDLHLRTVPEGWIRKEPGEAEKA
jgi:small-conductance mechanosensitive channel